MELKKLSDELRDSETRYRLMIESVTDFAIYTLSQDGYVTSWNEGASRIYGYSSDEIIGQHRSRFFTAEDVANGLPQKELDEAAETGRYSEEAWRVRKDGTSFWANGAITAVRGDTGVLQGFVKIVRDLTERKQAEIERTRTLEALQLRDRAIRAVSHGIVITDAQQGENPILYASPGFERLTGYCEEEVAGRNFEILIAPKAEATIAKTIRESIRAGKDCSIEFLNYRKDGTPFWNAQFISPVRDDQGQLIQFVCVSSDVTQRRSLEDQLRQSQKMEAVGHLAGGVAHDFNNLTTVILGYSDLLLSELPLNDSKYESVEAIYEAANRATDLTRQLLTFSRKTLPELKPVDLNKVVADTDKMLRRVIGEDVTLTTVLDPSIGNLEVDPGQMRQVLLNLVVNARDAMPLGGKLTIETKRVELEEPYENTHVEVAAGRYVLLSVTDTGTGMTPEVRSRIFEPFYTTKEVGKGTGLGLSVVHGIVKQSRGHIGAYTEFGIGTTFKIYLPAIDDGRVSLTGQPDLKEIRRGNESVLIVEDEESVRQLAWRILKSQGYKVFPAADGKEAIELLSKHPQGFDLLLTDVIMPGMNGPQLVEALRPSFPKLKVLFVSGYTSDTVVRHGVLNADVAFLQKPFTPSAFLNKVRQVLDEAHN